MNANIEKYVVPHVENEIPRLKRKRNLVIAMIPIGFIMFGVGGYLTTVNPYLLTILICGFVMFGLGAGLLAGSINKICIVSSIVAVKKSVECRDKVLLFQLGNGKPDSDIRMANLINKLIETGNLTGYTVIADVMVAKTDKYITEEQALEEYQIIRFGRPATTVEPADENGVFKECYYCHAKLSDGDTYCPNCGARINNY
jgi:hypothetical protein